MTCLALDKPIAYTRYYGYDKAFRFIKPRRKTLGFSPRDIRRVPFKAAWVDGQRSTIDNIWLDAVYCLYEQDSVQVQSKCVLLMQVPCSVVSEVSPQGADG